MKILVVGGTGLIGSAVTKALKKLEHEVIIASKNKGEILVDLEDPESITRMYESIPDLEAVVCAPKGVHQIGYASSLNVEDYQKGMQVKGFGQINLVLIGQHFLKPGGSFTLTTGILTTGELAQTSAVATVNGAVEGFVRGAAGELHNHMRINAVSPNVIVDALERLHELFVGYEGIPLEQAVNAYVRSVAGKMSGMVIKAW